jgi:hypothetical protein
VISVPLLGLGCVVPVPGLGEGEALLWLTRYVEGGEICTCLIDD